MLQLIDDVLQPDSRIEKSVLQMEQQKVLAVRPGVNGTMFPAASPWIMDIHNWAVFRRKMKLIRLFFPAPIGYLSQACWTWLDARIPRLSAM